MGENYEHIVDCLTSSKVLQIEVYIHELLKLILNNALTVNKWDTIMLYDRLETHMRTLESLGIKSEK